jgi:hypothetical protein
VIPWGETLDVPVGSGLRVDVGVRMLWAARQPGQWWIGERVVHVETEEPARIEVVDAPGLMDGDPPTHRMARAAGPARVRVVPRPPDRPVIARTEVPLTVPAGGHARVYVGVPVWLAVNDGEVLLLERPALRLSDTWFGTNREGTLCYATRTHLSMDRAAIPLRAYRALLTAQVHNRGADDLVLERVRIPAPSLALHAGTDRLWASEVRIERAEGADARVTVLDGPPDEAGATRRVGPPRTSELAPALSRAFSVITRGLAGGYV